MHKEKIRVIEAFRSDFNESVRLYFQPVWAVAAAVLSSLNKRNAPSRSADASPQAKRIDRQGAPDIAEQR